MYKQDGMECQFDRELGVKCVMSAIDETVFNVWVVYGILELIYSFDNTHEASSV